MKKYLFFLITILMVFVFSSCSDNDVSTEDTSSTIDKTTEIELEVPDEPEKPEITEEIVEEDEEIIENTEELDPNKEQSKLDGVYYDKELLLNRPVVISIDNHPLARWQAGLSQAEIVYEVEAEVPYTRYLAVFQTQEPELIGPVRSARPYMIYLALGFDSIFAHVGGSDEAFALLETLRVANIDGIFTNSMWRYYDTGKTAPNNLYTDLESLRNDANNRGYRTDYEYEGLSFFDKNTELVSDTVANSLKIVYNEENNTEYVYDDEKEIYTRFKDGEAHVDENDGESITAKNIIIYRVDRSVLDDYGRLYLGVVGQGNGYYITNGKSIDITWEKADEWAETKYFYNDEPLVVNPGNTWIQVISHDDDVILE